MIKYQLWKYGEVRDRIKKVEVKRETAAFVVFDGGRRDAKNCESCRYFDTFEEAASAMAYQLKTQIGQMETKLHRLKARYEQAVALTEQTQEAVKE